MTTHAREIPVDATTVHELVAEVERLRAEVADAARVIDVVRAEKVRLRGLLGKLVGAALNGYGNATVSDRQYATFWDAVTAAAKELGQVESGSPV